MPGEIHKIAAHIDYGVHSQHRKQNAGKCHAQNTGNHIRAGIDANGGRENQVASAKEDGKHSKSQYQGILRPSLFHFASSLSYTFSPLE